MSDYKRQLFDQLEHCSSRELSAAVRNTKRTFPLTSTTLTMIMEYIVCRILLTGVHAWRSMTLEKVKNEFSSWSYDAFKKLCEVSYRRQQSDGQSGLPQDIPYTLVQAVRKVKKLLPLFDSRTLCDIYPPVPMSNIFLLASTELERFLSAVHLLDQPIEIIQAFVESALRNGKNESVLIYLVGLASKHTASVAYKALPHLLQYMWHEITDHDAAIVSRRLKVVIRCYCEAKRSSTLSAFKSNSKGYHARRIQNSRTPLGCFLSSTKGQHIVDSYINGYRLDPFIHKTLRASKYWRLRIPHHTRNLTTPQTVTIRDHFQDMSDDMRQSRTIVMPPLPRLPISMAFINGHDLDDDGDWSQVLSGRRCNTRDQRSKDALCCNLSAFFGVSSGGVRRLAHSSITRNQPSPTGKVDFPLINTSNLITVNSVIPETMYPVVSSRQQIPSHYLPVNRITIERRELSQEIRSRW